MVARPRRSWRRPCRWRRNQQRRLLQQRALRSKVAVLFAQLARVPWRWGWGVLGLHMITVTRSATTVIILSTPPPAPPLSSWRWRLLARWGCGGSLHESRGCNRQVQAPSSNTLRISLRPLPRLLYTVLQDCEIHQRILVVNAEGDMVLVAQRVVEVRGQAGFIALNTRCCEELFAVSL